MRNEVKSQEHFHGCGRCFVQWGLWFFIIGVILGFGVFIHYLVGSAYDNSNYFLSNITLWFGSPLALSAGFLQIGGLGMAIIGILYKFIAHCCTPTTIETTTAYQPQHRHGHSHGCMSLTLCIIGLIALIVTGYIGYYIIDYIWPGFYYAPIDAGKNLWLILQGVSILVYIIGVIIATLCLSRCRHYLANTTTTTNR